MGFIYKYTSPSGKEYIGLTARCIKLRWKEHINDYKRALKCGFKIKCCVALYLAFHKYGIESFTKEILIECDNKDLSDNEKKMIIKHNTLSPNGYNLNSGGEQDKQLSDETIQKMRKHISELYGLPKYVQYGEWKKSKYFIISGHPKCRYKKIQDSTLNIEELKIKVLRFISDLDTNVYVVNHNRELPKNIMWIPNKGYSVTFRENGKQYSKLFGTKLQDENILKNATDFRNLVLQNGIINTYIHKINPHKHISISQNNHYIFKLQYKSKVYKKNFALLDDAIAYRDNLYKELKLNN